MPDDTYQWYTKLPAHWIKVQCIILTSQFPSGQQEFFASWAPHHIPDLCGILHTSSAWNTGICRTPVENIPQKYNYHVNYMIIP